MLLAVLCAFSVQAAERIAVPLTVPFSYLEARAASELGMDATGFVELSVDSCKRLELWNLAIETRDEALELTISMRAHAGVSLFDACRGPDPLDGQIVMQLSPASDDEGQAVLFQALNAEVRAPDGSSSLLTTPSRMLAESLLLPKLQAMRVDVGESLRAIDALIEQFLGSSRAGESPLAERGHLTEVAMRDTGMDVQLAFALRSPESEAISALGSANPYVDAAIVDSEESPLLSVPPETGVAALDDAELLQWQRVEDELDGFLTVVITHLGAQTDNRDLQLDLLSLLIDARASIAELLLADADIEEDIDAEAELDIDRERVTDIVADAGKDGEKAANAVAINESEADAMESAEATVADPLRSLFLDAWARLAAIAGQLPQTDTGEESGLRMASFLAAGDALKVVDALGPSFGIEVSRDGLRRLARLLMAGEAPVSFTPLPLAPDKALQQLFGFGASLPDAQPGDEELPVSWLRALSPVRMAFAQDQTPAQLLRQIFPRRATLDSYLGIVAQLIAESLELHYADSRLSEVHRELFEPLVRATAWKETCWRHYLPENDAVVVIRSSVGAIGMMQIVGRVWRSVFDLERLEADVDYNVGAGIHILEHYFLHYALRRGEHEQPGGMDNLVKATYAAYNGGPSKLSRYRREGVSKRAQAVDAQFFKQYLVMREQPWPRESRCYVR